MQVKDERFKLVTLGLSSVTHQLKQGYKLDVFFEHLHFFLFF